MGSYRMKKIVFLIIFSVFLMGELMLLRYAPQNSISHEVFAQSITGEKTELNVNTQNEEVQKQDALTNRAGVIEFILDNIKLIFVLVVVFIIAILIIL